MLVKIVKAATRRCSQEKVFWKYAANLANLQESTHVEVRFQ